MKEKNILKRSKRGQRFEKNPFLSTSTILIKTKKMTDKTGEMMVVNKARGEIISHIAGFWQAQEVDSAKFVKLYVNGVKQFKELTASGTRVFEILFLLVQENIGKDEIWLTFPSLDQALTPMGETTFYRGIKELIEKGFIAESLAPGKFWLNPSFMWNGDRLDFLKTFYKTGSKPKEFLDAVKVTSKEQTESPRQLTFPDLEPNS